ncbi:MAG: class I SAM-dependent methyltransferase [Gemmatimonadaceae bacterium]|nr:class I SAM-dependent methyltransferase [Gloeobacterales cyanobacterium ES-bin-141]
MSDDKSVSYANGVKDFSYFQCQRPEMLPYIPREAVRILDVGCGAGEFGRSLKAARAVEVWGVEMDASAATAATRYLDHVLCEPFDPMLHLPTRGFDCIIFNDVLEHLVDPFAALIYARELLGDNGVVVCSIPNVRFWQNMKHLLIDKDWQYTEHGILDRTHLRFFTRRSILSTFDNLEYNVTRIEGINPSLSRKFRLLNWLLFNQIADMRYLQFAVVASPRTA